MICNETEYVVFGKGAKTMVILPGLSAALSSVEKAKLGLQFSYRMFSKEFTVYVLSRKKGGTSIADMAQDTAKTLQMLGLKDIYLLGVSQGGMLSQHIAAAYPNLVRRLVLAVTCRKSNDIVKQAADAWIAMAEQNDYLAILTSSAQKSYTAEYFKKYKPFLPLIAVLSKPKTFTHFINDANACRFHDASDCQITCPTLVLGGGKDAVVGFQAASELAACIPHSQLHIYEMLSHSAFEQAPDFNQRVFSFFMQ